MRRHRRLPLAGLRGSAGGLDEGQAEELVDGGPLRGVSLEAPEDEGPPLCRHLFGYGRGLGGGCDVEEGCNVVGELRVGGIARRHLQHGTADAPHVALSGVALLGNNLWRHENRSSLEAEGCVVVSRLVQVPRSTKVGQLAHTPVVYEDVLTLDVSVNDALLVQIQQPLQHLPSILPNHALIQAPKPHDQIRHTPARHVLKKN
mmetsp:Transcript_41026/g.102663  ORF Transcript_41026/g.102663 Transcript_41026/m.102663 type:complete len:203 (-) Transcript_41026:1544-2152(-)